MSTKEEERRVFKPEVSVSQYLYEAFGEAVKMASRYGNYLDETHLILAIARAEGNGSRILEAMVLGKKQAMTEVLTREIERMRAPTLTTGLVTLKNTDINVGRSLEDILSIAAGIAESGMGITISALILVSFANSLPKF